MSGPISVGKRTGDERNPDADLLIVGITSAIASEYAVDDGETVADHNPNYPDDDLVVEVVYLTDGQNDLDDAKRYAFPVSRLSEVDR